MLASIDAGFVLSHDIETISFACREMMAWANPCSAVMPENIESGVEAGWCQHAIITPSLSDIVEQRDRLPADGQRGPKAR